MLNVIIKYRHQLKNIELGYYYSYLYNYHFGESLPSSQRRHQKDFQY